MQFSIASSALLFAVSALALPASELQARQAATTCGTTAYSLQQVTDAFNQGYNYYVNGQQVGNGNYPHQYNNYEGFNFPVGGPYQEFPLTTSGVFTGGTPGADRIVFNTAGQYAGAITHWGAANNAFVGCSGTS